MSNYGKNKLTDKQRQDIQDLKGTASAYFIADRFNISHTMVYKIWKKVSKQTTSLDTQILIKIIPCMIKANVEVDITDKEYERIKQIAEEEEVNEI